MIIDEGRIRSVLEGFVGRSDVGAISFALATPATGWSMLFESEPSRPFFAGSVTKLYTTAIILQLVEEGSLELGDPITRFLHRDVVAGIHVYREVDYSEQITVRQLLSHTSGLANYLTQTRSDSGSVLGDALERDRGWTFDQVLAVARTLRPAFPPGASRRAHFSHTNFALLGQIVEQVTQAPWEAAVVERIIGPLGLTGSWPFSVGDVERYDGVAPLLHRDRDVRLPLTMASVRAQGGLVSTAEDGVIFLQALLTGRLFDAALVGEMTTDWRPLNVLDQAGIGIVRTRLPRWRSGGGPREFLGHSGSTGALLYCAPAEGIYLSGTVNQLQNPRMSRQLLTQLSRALVPVGGGE